MPKKYILIGGDGDNHIRVISQMYTPSDGMTERLKKNNYSPENYGCVVPDCEDCIDVKIGFKNNREMKTDEVIRELSEPNFWLSDDIYGRITDDSFCVHKTKLDKYKRPEFCMPKESRLCSNELLERIMARCIEVYDMIYLTTRDTGSNTRHVRTLKGRNKKLRMAIMNTKWFKGDAPRFENDVTFIQKKKVSDSSKVYFAGDIHSSLRGLITFIKSLRDKEHVFESGIQTKTRDIPGLSRRYRGSWSILDRVFVACCSPEDKQP